MERVKQIEEGERLRNDGSGEAACGSTELDHAMRVDYNAGASIGDVGELNTLYATALVENTKAEVELPSTGHVTETEASSDVEEERAENVTVVLGDDTALSDSQRTTVLLETETVTPAADGVATLAETSATGVPTSEQIAGVEEVGEMSSEISEIPTATSDFTLETTCGSEKGGLAS